MPSLQAMLRGHRPGELTIVTGRTGSGKTTLLNQLSLDLCAQGVPTLWGSFEIKNVRLMKQALTQFAGHSLVNASPEEFDSIAERFSALPLHYMKFFGGTDVDAVLDAMEYAVYVHDVEHIVLDNLQFMLSSAASGRRSLDRFEAQERALESFRRFATQHNVHISLVIHPRKEPDDTKLSLGSVFGTAKATQEADNVLILQTTAKGKYVDCRKNRFSGDMGTCTLRCGAGAHALRLTPAPRSSVDVQRRLAELRGAGRVPSHRAAGPSGRAGVRPRGGCCAAAAAEEATAGHRRGPRARHH